MTGKFSPPQASPDVQSDYLKKKQAMEQAFVDFHSKVMQNKVLDKNKSAAVKNTETAVVDKLVNSCVALENVNVGEGILALAVIALRGQLTMRDRINELEYDLCKALKTIETLTNAGKKADEPKKP